MSLSFNALESLRWLSSKKNIFFKMRVLDISHNGVKDLSGLEAVSSSLEVLRANDNLLTTLPERWERKGVDGVIFASLRELWLSRNHLKRPVEILRRLSSDTAPTLDTLVIYRNDFGQASSGASLSEKQLRHLFVARMSERLKVLDGNVISKNEVEVREEWWWCGGGVVVLLCGFLTLFSFSLSLSLSLSLCVSFLQRSVSYWKDALGQQLLASLEPTPVTLAGRRRQAGGSGSSSSSNGLSSSDKPWRQYMKKKEAPYKLPRRPTRNGKTNFSHPPSPSTRRRRKESERRRENEVDDEEEGGSGRGSGENGHEDENRDERDELDGLPPPGAFPEDTTPPPLLSTTASTTTTTSSLTSSGLGSISAALSMLPDLSGRLDRVGGRTMVAQQTRRAAVASGLRYVDPETRKVCVVFFFFSSVAFFVSC